MDILLLTQVLPYPPDSGPKVKTYYLIRYLAQNHRVTLVSFTRGPQEDDIRALRKYCAEVHTVPMTRSHLRDGFALVESVLTGKAWMMVRDRRQAMQNLVDRLSARKSFDIVHADQMNMAQYALRVKGARRVLDAHNALWQLYQRVAETTQPGPFQWLIQRDWRFIKRYEGQMCRAFDTVLTVSDSDRKALEEAARTPLVAAVIPIAVDTGAEAVIERSAQADHILHIGTMYWPPNIEGVQWFINEVFPLVRSGRPQAVFDVVGARPPEELLRQSQPGSGITITGYVPDVSEYLQKAGVFVVPLLAGSGMRVKILEALARGLPVVTTTIGCEGIAVRDGEHLLVADTPIEFAAAILRVLEDPGLAQRLGRQGRALIEECYDYRVAYRPLETVYQPLSANPT